MLFEYWILELENSGSENILFTDGSIDKQDSKNIIVKTMYLKIKQPVMILV